MNLLLHIKIQQYRFSFQAPLVPEQAYYFDLDNFSSAEVIQVALEAIKKCSKLMLYIQISSDNDPGQAIKFISAAARFSGEVKVYFSGYHAKLNPLLAKIKGEELSNDAIVQTANNFFS